jgi:putative membrane-bound dehydrogenase-like protein
MARTTSAIPLALTLVFQFALIASFVLATPAEPPTGILPLGADGQPLNLDFETGDLRDWTATGDAFDGQPIQGDTVSRRRSDMASQHQGKYWIGGWERKKDAATGTLTSAPFRVTHRWCSFLVGGGPYENTCVELIRKDTGRLIARTSGIAEENLRRVVVDLDAHQGKDIYIRLVDHQSGHWGHINFDDFRFHDTKPDVPPRPAVREPGLTLTPDDYKYAGLSPEQSAAAMTVPEGFTVTLGAGEPDVRQPIAFAFDDRGRLWVAEAYNYPRRKPFPGPVLPPGEPGDRILIFEDTTGSGKLDKRTVFMEGLNLVSGIELGFGGVYVGAAPYLLFIPVDASGDKPAGPPQILLDGWAYQDTHETLNTFTWGPDGWLYGCHGVFTHSRVGKPGTPDKDRVPINAGIWRYHPTRHVFEVFAHGTSNPWGIAFDEFGEMFIEACVIPHCYHIVQGGRYERQAGNHFNPYTYADIQTIADHRHYLGPQPHGGNNRSDSAGGGHAHCGLMCYQGGAWPEEYRAKLFMGNIHGRRINMDILKPKGSSYVASHGKDFLLANDAWARFINIKYGPDGNAWLIDWYDQQACHDPKQEIWDRTNGRIYKISYRGTKPVTGLDLTKSTDEQLVEYQKHPNEWYAQHARRILQERYAKPHPAGVRNNCIQMLSEIAFGAANEPIRLRALWSIAAIGGWRADVEKQAASDQNEHVRAWSVRLSDAPQMMAGQLANDSSPVVRRVLASAAGRIGLNERWEILSALSSKGADSGDPIIPHLVWYSFEPLVEIDPSRALDIAVAAKVPNLLLNTVRRIATMSTAAALDLLVNRLATTDVDARAFLLGISEAVKGRGKVEMPLWWGQAFEKLSASKDAEVRDRAEALAVRFGDPQAINRTRSLMFDGQVPVARRQAALATLLEIKDSNSIPGLQTLIRDPALSGFALRALARFDDPKTPGAIIGYYSWLGPEPKRDALATLASRPAYAQALIAAVKDKRIPTGDIPAPTVRQLRSLRDPAVDAAVAEIWGVVRNTPADRAKEITAWRNKLTSASPSPIDLSMGRAVFAKTCASCHKLFGEGSDVGPEITGANRASLDYLLENILDPSAVIAKEYTATRIELKKGVTIICIVKSETPQALTVATDRETLTIPKNEIASREPSETSMMPDDQLKLMSEDEVRALFAYLQSPKQVPLPKTNGIGK